MLKLQEETQKLKADVEALELERNFYFNKVIGRFITSPSIALTHLSSVTSRYWCNNSWIPSKRLKQTRRT